MVNLLAPVVRAVPRELPFYQRLHRDGKGKVGVLGIDYQDTQPDGALALAEETGVTYPLLADPDGLLRAEYRIRGPAGRPVRRRRRQGHQRGGLPSFTVIRSYDQLDLDGRASTSG